MTKKVFKYSFQVADLVHIEIGHKLLEVLSVGKQSPCAGRLELWALVDVDEPDDIGEIQLIVYGTGHELDYTPTAFIGTVMDGPFVWHVWHT